MANRYWVGGVGNWSDDDNHWASSSGGAPSDGNLPTSLDNVFFDSNSGTGQVTINVAAYCNNIDVSGVGSALTIYALTSPLYVYGNIVGNAADNVTWTGPNGTTNGLRLSGTSSQTITTNGSYIGNWIFDGVGGTWTFQDNYRGNYIFLLNGTVDTNNKSVELDGAFNTSGTGTKVLTLSSNNFKCGSFSNDGPTGFTFNYNTSTVQLYSVGGNIRGTNTFYNLIFLPYNDVNHQYTIRGNQTINNNLIITGYNATNRRILIYSSNTTAVTSTFTAANVSVSNADFLGIKGAGAGDWDLSGITGLSGDCGYNADITFTTPQTQYWHEGTGSWSNPAKWFTATNGGGSAGRVPLPQDGVIFDVNSIDSSGSTITIDCARVGRTLTMTDVSPTHTISLPNHITCFGQFLLKEGVTVTHNSNSIYVWSLDSDNKSINIGQATIFTLAVGIPYTFSGTSFNAAELTYYNLSSFTCISYLNLYSGLDFNDFNVTTRNIQFQNNFSDSLLGSGTLTITGTSGEVFSSSSSARIVCETSTVYFNPTSGSSDVYAAFWPRTFYNLRFGGSHTGNFIVKLAGTVANPDYTGGTLTCTTFATDAGRKVKFYKDAIVESTNWTLTGASDSIIYFDCQVSESVYGQYTFKNLSEVSVIGDYLHLTYCNAIPYNPKKIMTVTPFSVAKNVMGKSLSGLGKIMGVKIYAWYANNSTDNGNNTGWIF